MSEIRDGPIRIVDYDPQWPALFETERARIIEAIGSLADIQHVGSTAVPGLAAKPTIDIMVGMAPAEDPQEFVAPLEALGYLYRGEVVFPGGHYFKKLLDNARTHNIHMCEESNPEWERHIRFRDYLRTHPEAAREYAELKRQLATRFGADRIGYTNAKGEFVEACIARAGGPPRTELVIVSYDARWPLLFEEERSRISAALGELCADIQHIGSTAVPHLAAKPIIDIMVAIRSEADMVRCIIPLVQTGYQCLGEFGIPGRIFFRKLTDNPRRPGQTHGGVGRTHHLHTYSLGHAEWDRHIQFRDYLRSHPDTAREYERLKRELAAQFPTDVEAYANAKTEFIRGVERAAIAQSPSPSFSQGRERGAPATQR